MKTQILAVAFLFTTLSFFAQSKVGTIDAEYILSQMPEIGSVDAGLKSYNDELQAELQTSVTKYEELVTAYQAEIATYTEEEKTTKEEEIIALENEIKNFRNKATVMMQMRRNDLTKPLYDKIDKAMMEVITEGGYTQILKASANGLAFAAAEFDITDPVLEKLGITPAP